MTVPAGMGQCRFSCPVECSNTHNKCTLHVSITTWLEQARGRATSHSDFVVAWNCHLVFRQLHTFKYVPDQQLGLVFSFNHTSYICSLDFIKVFPSVRRKVTTPTYFKGNRNNNFLLPLLGRPTYETGVSNGFCLAI